MFDSIKTEFMNIVSRMELVPFFEKDFANLIVLEEISKRRCPLGYVFADFSRKRKSVPVGGTSPRNQKFDVTLLEEA